MSVHHFDAILGNWHPKTNYSKREPSVNHLFKPIFGSPDNLGEQSSLSSILVTIQCDSSETWLTNTRHPQ